MVFQHCKVGHLLCRSRNPDFLLDILNRQASGGQSSSMPWLAELVESSEGSLGALPVQCLCEFLLTSQTEEGDRSEDGGHEEGDAKTVSVGWSLVANHFAEREGRLLPC